MRYIAGIDGGGTKTHCVVGDENGHILSEGLAAGSNHQAVGEEAAEQAVCEALRQAMEPLGITAADLSFIVFGLAGADIPQDYAILTPLCERICGHTRFKLMTDTWVGLRAGIPENWGIVTVCGTGGSCSGRNRDGREVTLRNLTYEAGNRGGGIELARIALHYAFRSEEKTGPYTRLQEEIPQMAGMRSMDELVPMVCAMNPDPAVLMGIPILVCRLAEQGDEVCQNMLIEMGTVLGRIAGGVAKRLEMEKIPFGATLVGGLFKSQNPLLLDAYSLELHKAAPFARISVAKEDPAVGAYLLAMAMCEQDTI